MPKDAFIWILLFSFSVKTVLSGHPWKKDSFHIHAIAWQSWIPWSCPVPQSVIYRLLSMVYRLSSVKCHVRMPNPLTHCHLYFKFGERGGFTKLIKITLHWQTKLQFSKQKNSLSTGLAQRYDSNRALTAIFESLAPNGLKINR